MLSDTTSSRSKPPMRIGTVLPVVVIVIAAALTAFVIWQASSDDSPDQSVESADETQAEDGPEGDGPVTVPEGGVEPEQPDLSDIERRAPEDLLAVGPAEAPVALVMFSDFQCPFCATWHEETLPTMMDYVEAGDLRIEWRDVNVFGDASERAARASYAAALQGQFLRYHELLFPNGETLSEAQLSEESLIELAQQLDMDVDQFEEDLKSAEVADQISANAEEGLSIGAYSTPTFIVAGEPIVGAQPTEVFISAVDDALADAD
ncbi:DsbA family protein [Nesterenkonia natronophila]|nr:DsbA family protein [Nesterenkonia natronophila]